MSARAWVLVSLSALLQTLLYPKPNLFYLSWIAFVPWLYVLIGADRRPVRRDFLIGWLCGALWYLGTCYWIYISMRSHGGLGVGASVLVLVLFCLYLGLYHGLFAVLLGWLRQRGMELRWMILAAPVLWVAVELARSRATSFPWDLLGCTQVDNLPLTRIAPWTGVYGLSFVVMLVNAAVAGGMILKRRGWPLLIAGLSAAVVLQSGLLVKENALATDHEAVLLQQNLPLEFPQGWQPSYFDATLSGLARASEPDGFAETSGTKLIVWPESPAPFMVADLRFNHWMGALAEDARAYVIAGSIGTPPSSDPQNPEIIYNSAALFTPGGKLASRYDKVHLVPFGEYIPFSDVLGFASSLTREVGTFTHGTRRPLLEMRDVRAGTFICYESVFPDEVRQFVKSGANVLVNISNDGWFGDSGAPGQHLRMARMRAIENHRWLLRDTNNGITAVADPLGRVTESLPMNVRATLLAHYGVIAAQTFYTVHGDLFAYLCAIITIAVLVFASIARNRFEPQRTSRALRRKEKEVQTKG
jgi:apolipoprotein N-acyltransferase